MSVRVAVIDYGAGNILNLARALAHLGVDYDVLTIPPGNPADYSHVVLPGAGSFQFGMHSLRARGLDDFLLAWEHAQQPILGICLGMHLLADIGFEGGEAEGLGIIPGTVNRINVQTVADSNVRLPHVGWARVQPVDNTEPSGVNRPGRAWDAYFTHSYHFEPDSARAVTAWVEFGKTRLVASVRTGHVSGFQFHPEKSGANGLTRIGSWLRS